MLKIKLSAAPEKGKANECLIEFLADLLNVPNKDISIVSGHTNPIKHIKIDNLDRECLVGKINPKHEVRNTK